MELTRKTGKEDGRVVYIYTIAGCDHQWIEYKSDIQAGITAPDEILQRLIDIRGSSTNDF